MTDTAAHYRAPGFLTRHVMNPTVALLARAGIGVWGARTLEVAGRRSGEPRRTPVNPLSLDGHRYVVAARGETEWVRNVRAAGRLALLIGRRREDCTAVEVDDDAAKVAVLRAYLARWKAEVGIFFDGVSATSSDEEVRAIAPRHPVFVLTAPAS